MAKRNQGPKARQNRRDFIAYWGYCIWCGSRENLTVDHIVPISRGGTNHQFNWQCLCKNCNLWKADKLVEEIEYEEEFGVDSRIQAIIDALEKQ